MTELRPTRMLLVEDNPGDAFLVSTLVQDSPETSYDVMHATTMREAVVMLEAMGPEDLPDLIMLDLSLPDSNGMETITRLREFVPDVPMIVLTGLKDEKLAIEALRYGAEDYLTKDFTSGAPIRRAVRYAIERKRAETARRETENLYRQLVELAPELIATLQNGRITFINGPGARMLGAAEPDDVVGRAYADFLSAESAEAVLERLAPLLAPESDARGGMIETLLHRLDGSLVEMEIRAVRFDQHGLPAVLLVGTDVTEAHKMQRHLVQNSKMATLGEMAASVAHEVNQPLNIIRMAADACLMEYEIDRVRPEFQNEKLNVITEQTGRMAEIIDHMRIYSRRDTPGQERFDPFRAVRSALEMVGNDLEQFGIRLETAIAAFPQNVTGHRVQLEQVVVNLLVNARDAILETMAEEGGSGLIRVTAYTEPEDGLVRILVNDNGGGVPDEALDLIFDPFFTTKDVGHGTGLGLSVSLGIIQGMGGEMEVRNEGDGACFEIVLPLNPDDDAPQFDELNDEKADEVMTEALLHGSDAAHILVVDDELEAGKLICDFLIGQGYQVSQATDGIEALQVFDRDPPDMLITDVRMPQMDGNELVRRVRDQYPAFPILIATGHTGDIAIGDLIADGRGLVLSKPLNLRELSGIITRLCG